MLDANTYAWMAVAFMAIAMLCLFGLASLTEPKRFGIAFLLLAIGMACVMFAPLYAVRAVEQRQQQESEVSDAA